MKPRSSALQSLLTRPTLLFRLRNREDQLSWDEFYRLYRSFVYGLAFRSGLTHAEAEDVVQEVFTHVLNHISEFETTRGAGSFRRWLMNQVKWRVMDRYRQRARQGLAPQALAEGAQSSVEAAESAWQTGVENEHEQVWEKEWKDHVLAVAMNRLARRAPPKQFQAFELYSHRGWPAERVCATLGINAATLYLYNHRLMRQLRSEAAHIRHLLR